MRKKVAAGVIALLAGGLMLSHQEVSAGDGGGGGFGKATYLPGKARMQGWIDLHRPDGEVVYVKADQIVFVMSATNTGADKRANSKIQLANGFFDARESVEEVMQALQNDDSLEKYGS